MIFINGLGSAPRCLTGFNYMTELWPSKYLSMVSTMFLLLEGTIVIWISLFYMNVSTNWQYLFLYGVVVGTIA